MSRTQTFTTTLLATGGTNVGIEVPADVLAAFDRGARVPVVVTIDGDHSYRSTTASMGGRVLISFNAETRERTGLGAGDEVTVRLDLDTASRAVEAPAALAERFGEVAGSAEAWERLSPSKQKAHATSITSARTDDTRDRRIRKVLDALAPTG